MAIALIYLAFCRSGSHALIPFSAYGPNRELAAGLLKGLGIEVEPYDPPIGSGRGEVLEADDYIVVVEDGPIARDLRSKHTNFGTPHAIQPKITLLLVTLPE